MSTPGALRPFPSEGGALVDIDIRFLFYRNEANQAALQKHAAAGESDMAAGILLDEDLEPDQDRQNKSSGRVIDLTDDMPEAARGVSREGPSGDPHSADNLADQSMSAHDLFTSSIRTQPSKASRYLDALDRCSPHRVNSPSDTCLGTQ